MYIIEYRNRKKIEISSIIISKKRKKYCNNNLDDNAHHFEKLYVYVKIYCFKRIILINI